MDFRNLYFKLKKFSQIMDFHEPVSVEEINRFQKQNGLNLPNSLIDLLRCFDGGELFIPGTIIYGIREQTNGNTIKRINGKQNRKSFNIPSTYLIIGKLNFGDWLCIDLNRTNEVIQWDHEVDEEFCRWNSLEDWLEETINEYIEYEGGAH